MLWLTLGGCGGGSGKATVPNAPAGEGPSQPARMLRVVAAENEYGNIAEQLGGEHVKVLSIISDPNVDPHEYEANVQDVTEIAQADLVIENGLDYDQWIDKLMAASPNSARVVLNAGTIAVHSLRDNPHVWYDLGNMAALAGAISKAFTRLDPADQAYFQHRLDEFNKSLQPIADKIAQIRERFAGTPTALTETLCLFQTDALKLDILTPWDFMHAIAEGNDPSVQSLATTRDQVRGRKVRVLLYNVQTITPITSDLKKTAQSEGIPIVPVSETMPLQMTYQTWMLSQLDQLQAALEQTVKQK
ncbi:MAG: metal ABC transporter solute-binding protein, Zn/Mn family [Planctomycetota bacterium]